MYKQKEAMVKLSIIIPHKNSGKLLERLLKSIPLGSDFQVIVCDDNSDDKELNYVKNLQKEHSFELYLNEGKGAGGARNTALKHATGEWLFFADADDFLLKSFSSLVSQYLDTKLDLVLFNVSSCYSDTLLPAYRGDHINSLFEKYEITGNINDIKLRYLSPIGKLIKNELVKENQIEFEEIPAANDIMFSIKVALAAKQVVCDKTPIYMITVSSGSITTTLSKERFESKLQANIRVNKLLRKHGFSKYQLSVLYYLGMGYQFGLRYELHVIWTCVKNRMNPFIGIKKILHLKKTLRNKQNNSIIKDQRDKCN